jgi:hypothetical protein
VSALARWDAVWYLLIANKTYVGPHGIPAPAGNGWWDASINFFPGYPMLVRVVSGLALSPRLVISAAYVVSLAAFVIALYLLYRLAELELGARAATWAVVLLAVFPGAVFLGAPYAESLFLALSIGCIYAARTGHWRAACALGAAAAATRLPGVLLVVPLTLFYLHGPSGRGARRSIGSDAAWLLLVPAALLAYFGYASHLTGDPLAYFHIGKDFGRGFSQPLSAVTGAFRATSHALRAIVNGPAAGDPGTGYRYADLTGAVAFMAGVALTISACRHLPRAYGAYCVASLLVIFCTGPDAHPLSPAMRYTAVVFPLFMEAGRLAATRPRAGWVAAGAMVACLGVVTSLYARWFFLG